MVVVLFECRILGVVKQVNNTIEEQEGEKVNVASDTQNLIISASGNFQTVCLTIILFVIQSI